VCAWSGSAQRGGAAAAVVVVVAVVDRAVRSAGKAFSFERELGPQRCGLSQKNSQLI